MEKDLLCSICDFTTKQKSIQNKRLIHGGKPFQHFNIFEKKENLQTHIKSVHESQKFPCPQCEYKATEKGHLQRHIKSVHEGQKFQCSQCEYKATFKGSLQRHIMSVHRMKVKSSNVHNVNMKQLRKETFRCT